MNPTIEAYRGLAAIMVLTHHYSYIWPGQTSGSEWLHGLHNGVDLFFVITGYVFAPHVLREVRDSIGAFAIRRVFRIYPLYITSLLGFLIFIVGDRSDTYPNFLRHIFFSQNFAGLSEAGYFSFVYWTLPVEVSYYLLVAVWMFVPLRGVVSWRVVGIAGALFGATAYFWHTWSYAPQTEGWVILQAQLPPLLIEFWLGVVAYRITPFFRSRYLSSCLIAFLGAALLSILLVTYNEFARYALTPRPFGLFNLLSAVAYAFLLIGSIGMFSNTVNASSYKNIVHDSAIYMGSLSYGIYLFHELILLIVQKFISGPAFLVVLTAMTTTFATALFFHKALENPCRMLGRRIAHVMQK
jgi:peptidoglycan/LPS O-acetylase OafA/YrhL